MFVAAGARVVITDVLDEFGEMRALVEERIPFGRTAGPDEVGRLVQFLASDGSSYCSGHEFVVDGAMTA
jgi:3alpha(or 20beta)-hydroxysteroid dehydrogenase